jgi:hypothetical protein
MYTSGPKKVSVFPPGFVPGNGASGGVAQPPKQAINQGPIFASASAGTGSGLNLGSGLPKNPPKGVSASLPQPPKLPVVPNAKYGMPGMVKTPLPGMGPGANVGAGSSTGSISVAPKFSPHTPATPPPATSSTFESLY